MLNASKQAKETKLYFHNLVNSSTSGRTASSGGTHTLFTHTFTKALDDTYMVFSLSVPVINESQGWGSGVDLVVDGVVRGDRSLYNISGIDARTVVVDGLSKGDHTVQLKLLNGGGGSTTVGAYSRVFLTMLEVSSVARGGGA